MPKRDKRQMPDIVFVGPPQARQKFKYVVFKVDRRGDGEIPRKLTLVLDHETIDLQGGEEFMTGYIPAHMLKPGRATE